VKQITILQKSMKALIVLSGGQDSTTCLFWAKHKFSEIHAITFNYGQKHQIELEAAKKVAELAGVASHKFLDIDTFQQIGKNSLVDKSIKVGSEKIKELPSTFVPGRNLVFLTFAAAYAWTLGIDQLVTGVSESDYSGYPDCRENTMISLAETLSLGIGSPFVIHTPLMHISKAETVKLAMDVGAMEALAFSHTCYNGAVPPCGVCDSCQLRAKGFAEAGIPDPLFSTST